MNLQGELLIAMPHIGDYFERTVIYICEHNAQGAMGLVINCPTDLSIAELYSKLNFMSTHNRDFGKDLVLSGGPMHGERGFIVHTPTVQSFEHTYDIKDGLLLTTSPDIIDTFGTEYAPEHYLVALGCANWAPDQLEQEIADNMWLVAPANKHILFHAPYTTRYATACRLLRIFEDNLISQVGHA